MQPKRSSARNPPIIITIQKVPNGFQVLEPTKADRNHSFSTILPLAALSRKPPIPFQKPKLPEPAPS